MCVPNIVNISGRTTFYKTTSAQIWHFFPETLWDVMTVWLMWQARGWMASRTWSHTCFLQLLTGRSCSNDRLFLHSNQSPVASTMLFILTSSLHPRHQKVCCCVWADADSDSRLLCDSHNKGWINETVSCKLFTMQLYQSSDGHDVVCDH